MDDGYILFYSKVNTKKFTKTRHFVYNPFEVQYKNGCRTVQTQLQAQRLGLIDDIFTLCRLQCFIYYSIDFIIIHSQIKQPRMY